MAKVLPKLPNLWLERLILYYIETRHRDLANEFWQQVYKVAQIVGVNPFFQQLEEYQIFLSENDLSQISEQLDQLVHAVPPTKTQTIPYFYYFKNYPFSIKAAQLCASFSFSLCQLNCLSLRYCEFDDKMMRNILVALAENVVPIRVLDLVCNALENSKLKELELHLYGNLFGQEGYAFFE